MRFVCIGKSGPRVICCVPKCKGWHDIGLGSTCAATVIEFGNSRRMFQMCDLCPSWRLKYVKDWLQLDRQKLTQCQCLLCFSSFFYFFLFLFLFTCQCLDPFVGEISAAHFSRSCGNISWPTKNSKSSFNCLGKFFQRKNFGWQSLLWHQAQF